MFCGTGTKKKKAKSAGVKVKMLTREMTSTLKGMGSSLSLTSRRPTFDLNEFRIPADSVKLGRKIGEGGFGEVYLATYAKRQVVAKRVKVDVVGRLDALRGIEDELDVAVRMRSPCIVEVYGAVFSSEHLLLVMEHCVNGSVRDKLDEQPRCTLRPEQRLMILSQAAEGLKYLASRGIVHRDVKADNVLLDGYMSAKIGDFGIAKAFDDDASGIAGTIPFMAPELFKDEKSAASDKSDVYAFGCMCIEVLTGGGPWRGHASSAEEIVSRVRQGEQVPLPEGLPAQLASLIRLCTAQRREERPTFERVVDLLDDFEPSDWRAREDAQAELVKELASDAQKRLDQGVSAPLDTERLPKGSHVRVVGTSHGAGKIALGDVGVVQSKAANGDYVVDFVSQDGWYGKAHDLELDATAERIKPGQRVRLRSSVRTPRFGLGSLEPRMVGLVHEVTHDGIARIQFGFAPGGQPSDDLWAGTLQELEPAPLGAGSWPGALQCGQAVRVPAALEAPSTGWASVTKDSVGYVRARTTVEDTIVYVVDWPEQDSWKGRAADLELDPVANLVRPGVKVRVKPSVAEPKYNWGDASHASVGVVLSISYDARTVRVRFREQANWCALLSELEVVPEAGVFGALCSIVRCFA